MNSNWKRMLAAFLAGCLVGGGLGARIQKTAMRKWRRNGPNVSRLVKKLDRRLGLDPAQKAVVSKIIEERRKEIAVLRRKTRGRFVAALLSMRAQIERVLRPDQLAKFKAMEARWDARRKARWGGRPGPRSEGDKATTQRRTQ